MGSKGSFLGGKAAGGVKLTTHLHLVPRSNNAWSYTSTPQYAFMAWCLVKHRDNFAFTFTLLFAKCYWGDEVRDIEMDEMWRKQKCTQILVRKPNGKRPPGRPRRTGKDNIKL
jgi:hypothetical protein